MTSGRIGGRRLPAVVAAAVGLVLAACADAGVETRSAELTPAETTEVPTTTAPPTTQEIEPPAAPDEPTPTEPPDAAGPSSDDLASAGDSLFPAIGSDEVDVQSYDVRIAYDPVTEAIDGRVLIALTTEDESQIVLDAGEMEIESVSIGGAAAEFDQLGEELVIRPTEPAAAVALDVRYTDAAFDSASEVGLGIGWFATPGGSYVLNEPDGAHSWLPSNDHPSDKALWRFELTVPDGVTAVANGTLVEERPGDGTTTWVWEQADVMSTYLIQVLTGDYEVIDAGSYGDVPLVHVALRQDAALMKRYFEVTEEQLAFFEPLFGPYPLEGYGLAITDSFGGLAMETQGRSLFSREDLPGGEPGYIEHNLLSHELAHQWFGNAVSPADWGDLWLNESFASYGAWLWLDHIGIVRLEDVAADTLEARQYGGESTAEPSVGNLFGFERYDGGAVVLHALRLELGDDVFFDVLKTWVADHDGTSATTEDFVQTAETVADRSLTEFFETWLYAEVLPATFPR